MFTKAIRNVLAVFPLMLDYMLVAQKCNGLEIKD